ncbi:CheR family methyltransferase [Amorphus sp. MBR-141]
MNEHSSPPIVALGASAGGIQALQQFFEAMPSDSGFAFIVVLHLSPDHESHLTQILQRSTQMEVVQAKASAKLEPNCVYVIPPGLVLTLADDRLRVRKPVGIVERHHPIDAIFQSLADQRGAQAIGLIFSGSGSNGSAGAQAIREREGIVLVQDPQSADHPDMPSNVILSGLADLTLAPDAMPAILTGIMNGNRAGLLLASEDQLPKSAESEINAILSVLRGLGHHDFSPYKKKTLVRRILRRMGLVGAESLAAYAEKLQDDHEEVEALVSDLLINVTEFFRDQEAWETLRETVIEPLIRAREQNGTVRVWVPACSSGEEAYTIAMLLLEQSENVHKPLGFKVFATDAAPKALVRARQGVFPGSIAEAIPAHLLTRYFDKEGDLYRAKKRLREAVIFAPQNLLGDPPFSKIDIVSCRNLLIYLEPQVQEKVIALLHFSLREGGHLFLGTAETVGRHEALFQPVSKKWRIYRRLGATRHELVDFPLLGESPFSALTSAVSRHTPANEARDALLSAFAPPSVLIDEHNRILYFHGELGSFLQMPTGEPTLDLPTMVREELRAKVRAALRQARKEGMRVAAEATLRSGNRQRVTVTVTPLSTATALGRVLVSFEPRTLPPLMVAPLDEGDGLALSQGQLEQELQAVREDLRLSVEQLETSNEELKASNEEITSMNEELQSTNEELETTKEELQSLNEELSTVNTQLQGKVGELEDRTNDLDNLLNSTDIATLFLDDEFRIRWFSPPTRSLFQIRHSDLGRPITDFAQRFEDDSFLSDAHDVLRTLQPRDKEVAAADARWHLRRILPYRTDDNRIDGVVATFTDITGRKRFEEALAAAKLYAERIVDTTRQPLVVLNQQLIVHSANHAFYECFRLQPAEIEGKVLFEVGNGDWDIPELRQALREAMPDAGKLTDLVLSHDFRDLGHKELHVDARWLDAGSLILVAIEDVTARRATDREREVLISELRHRVRNLLAKILAIVSLSQEGKTSVAAFADELKERITAIVRTEEFIGTRSDTIGLRELVEAELKSVSSADRLSIEGPEVRLSAHAAQGLALMLHELTTNAVKHGAFSGRDGRLDVRWSVDGGPEAPRFRLSWEESGAAKGQSHGGGFGSRLIREIVPHMLGGATTVASGEDGVACTLTIPLSDAAGISLQ